ncbi:MAG: hypothetical protein CO108_17105 [Deltaproteobacteria bacterium CG_4_9_14_3_um_filter_63_12]|nr:MAG: hypothetical protein CO108_17105 [Deltaproteobacteria bacterium CG_4_9_14_3_um_filter_63_12]
MKKIRQRLFVALTALQLVGAPAFAFADSGTAAYTYCDAQVLAKHWKKSVKEAKAKLAETDRAAVEKALNDARGTINNEKREICLFHESRFSYDDAEALASAWGIGVSEVKATIESKLFWGSSSIIDDELARIRSGEGFEGEGEGAENDVNEAAANAFFESKDYNYCDARLLAAHWQIATWDAKVTIGQKIIWDSTQGLEVMLGEAREAAASRQDKCEFYEGPFTFEDAQLLAKSWDISVAEAKATIGNKLTWGGNKAVRSALDYARESTKPEKTKVDKTKKVEKAKKIEKKNTPKPKTSTF